MRRSVAGALITLVLAIGVGFALAGCSESADVPKCKPHAANCDQTADGDWIPYAYWVILLNQENLAAGATPTYQSSIPQSAAPSSTGVPDDELESDSSSASGGDESDSPDDENSASPDEGEDSGADEGDIGGDDDP